jgi:hypothetical protein
LINPPRVCFIEKVLSITLEGFEYPARVNRGFDKPLQEF